MMMEQLELNQRQFKLTLQIMNLSRDQSNIEELNRGQEEEKYSDISELRETFEDPNAVKANISIDDVCCKKQKASDRKKGAPPKEKREMVYNTVAHIQRKESKAYAAVSPTFSQMMIVVLALLLSNELLS